MPTKEQTARRPRYEAPSKEKQVLIKTLYQILQCLHHQRNFNTEEAGPKSFRCDVNWGLSNISDLWEQKSKHITANLKRFKTFPKIPRRDFHIDPKDTKYSIHWTTDTANTIITRWLRDLNIPIMRQFRPSQV